MSDSEFAKSSVIEFVVPETSDLDIEEILQDATEQDDASSLISTIPQRPLLYFGKHSGWSNRLRL